MEVKSTADGVVDVDDLRGLLDGRKLYFHNAAPNLFRIDRACAAIKTQHDGASDDNSAVRSKNVRQIMREAPQSPHRFGDAKRIKVRYTITVQPDAVPDGEVVRCWMPLPRTDIARQLKRQKFDAYIARRI